MAGSTSYPTSVDNKTALQDGVDIIQADDVNDAYVPLDAIETFIGPSGKNQSNNIDILDFLRYVLNPDNHMRVEYVDANTLKVKAGIIFCASADGSKRVMRRLASDQNVTFADLDTGSEQANTLYHLHAVADAANTSVTFKLSASASAPSGVTTFTKLCDFINDGSSNIVKGSIRNLYGSRKTKTGRLALHWGSIAGIDEGRLHCDGQAISRTLYANLFAFLGTKYGVGDGSTTFNLPQSKDLFLIGAKQDDSGVAKSNVDGALKVTGGDTNQPPHTTDASDEPQFQPDGTSGDSCTRQTHDHDFVPPFAAVIVTIEP